jgi:hypothetical protein
MMDTSDTESSASPTENPKECCPINQNGSIERHPASVEQAGYCMNVVRQITPETLRRLAISCQRLENAPDTSGRQAIMDVFRRIGCVQYDPLRAVERTQLLVLRSRLSSMDPSDLDHLLYDERQLFEYWAHAASIVLTEDFPLFWRHMRDWAPGDRPWMKRARTWMKENQALREHILEELESNGPMASKDFRDIAESKWKSTGWTNGQTVRMMLGYLWEQGEILISRRNDLVKLYDLRDRCLPEWTPRDDLDWPEVVHRAAQKSLIALGAGTESHITRYFTRDNYPGLTSVLLNLEEEGLVQQLEIVEDGEVWPGSWFIHSQNINTLDRIEAGDWQGGTNLLSPFDNLICDRDRTEKLFNFYFRIEIYVPKAQRQYGYYVMPILHGDRLIGRIDPKMDRKSKILLVNNIFAEPDAPMDMQTGRAVAQALQELGLFLGAKDIHYLGAVPGKWKKALAN